MLDVKWGSTCTSMHNGNGAVHECVCAYVNAEPI